MSRDFLFFYNIFYFWRILWSDFRRHGLLDLYLFPPQFTLNSKVYNYNKLNWQSFFYRRVRNLRFNIHLHKKTNWYLDLIIKNNHHGLDSIGLKCYILKKKKKKIIIIIIIAQNKFRKITTNDNKQSSWIRIHRFKMLHSQKKKKKIKTFSKSIAQNKSPKITTGENS